MNTSSKIGMAMALLACAWLPGPAARAQSTPPAAAAAEPAASVVVELFTSQGCSTCPPADALLGRLAHDPRWQGRLVPLALHVDYWNYGGWTDPFSSADWSQRQRNYAKTMALTEVYTPQAVVNGRAVVIGSNEPELRRLLADAAARPTGSVELHLRRDGAKVETEIVASPPPGRAGDLDVMLAIVESGLETSVKYGENAHRTLHDDFVVRRLERVARVRGVARRDTVILRLERGWKAEQASVEVFLQDAATHEIFGGASAAVPQ